MANLSSADFGETNNHFKTAIVGYPGFLCIRIFMTYKQLDTDFGVIMKYSLGSSMFFLSSITMTGYSPQDREQRGCPGLQFASAWVVGC